MRILYAIQGLPSESRTAFRDRVLAYARTSLAPQASSVVVAATEEKPPAVSVIPFRRDLMALISLDGLPGEWNPPAPPEGFAVACMSDAAFPVVHERVWPLGERSPGIGLLTFFRKKKGLGCDEFLRRWFEGHTPLTLEVHPNAGYVRNRIIGAFEAAGKAAFPQAGFAWDGIVEEQYDPPSDLLNPARFFGGSLLKMPGTMIRVYRDVKGFLDYASIRTWLTREYRLK